MKANEVVRLQCGECQIVFDLRVDHLRETDDLPVTDFEPTGCPFCGAGELTPVRAQPQEVIPAPALP
jgi:hypothetical protein